MLHVFSVMVLWFLAGCSDSGLATDSWPTSSMAGTPISGGGGETPPVGGGDQAGGGSVSAGGTVNSDSHCITYSLTPRAASDKIEGSLGCIAAWVAPDSYWTCTDYSFVQGTYTCGWGAAPEGLVFTPLLSTDGYTIDVEYIGRDGGVYALGTMWSRDRMTYEFEIDTVGAGSCIVEEERATTCIL